MRQLTTKSQFVALLYAQLAGALSLREVEATQDKIKSPLAFARRVRAKLMHRRHVHHLKQPAEPPPPGRDQGAFSWA